jgi:low affinity Fe/Cu permease
MFPSAHDGAAVVSAAGQASAPEAEGNARSMNTNRNFADFAGKVARLSGKPLTFILACITILVWGVTGPLFGFSDTWQLVINTGTTVVTFLMVFLIQNTQNRDGAAIQAKLDEIIRAGAARNSFIGIEHLTPEEVEEIRLKCEQRAKIHHALRHAKPHLQKEGGEAADSSGES